MYWIEDAEALVRHVRSLSEEYLHDEPFREAGLMAATSSCALNLMRMDHPELFLWDGWPSRLATDVNGTATLLREGAFGAASENEMREQLVAWAPTERDWVMHDAYPEEVEELYVQTIAEELVDESTSPPPSECPYLDVIPYTDDDLDVDRDDILYDLGIFDGVGAQARCVAHIDALAYNEARRMHDLVQADITCRGRNAPLLRALEVAEDKKALMSEFSRRILPVLDALDQAAVGYQQGGSLDEYQFACARVFSGLERDCSKGIPSPVWLTPTWLAPAMRHNDQTSIVGTYAFYDVLTRNALGDLLRRGSSSHGKNHIIPTGVVLEAQWHTDRSPSRGRR